MPETPRPSAAAAPDVVLRVVVTRAGEDGGPLAGAHVCAATTRGAEMCGDAAADGTTTFHGAPGTYFVRVSGPPEQRWQASTRAIAVTSSDATARFELVLLHRVTGRVRDRGGAAVPGALACAHPAGNDPPVCERSGADGTYAIDATAGVYRIEVSGPPGARLVSQWARGRAFLEEADIIDLRAQDVSDVDVTLAAGVVLRGTVTFAGAAVADAQVCIRTLAAPLPWDCERTDKSGRYAALREPGSYYVWTVPPANVRAVPQWYDGVLTGVASSVLRLGADRTLDIALGSGPQLSGVVRTSGGEAVANALVCVDTAFSTGRICRETDAAGRYAVTTRPETYVVSVYPPSESGLVAAYWDGKRTWKDADDVLVDRDRVLDLTVERGVRVTGVVTDPRGVPIVSATVNFIDGRSGAAASAESDSAGRFVVAVPAGRYSMEVFPPRTASLVERVMTVAVQSATELRVTLDDSTVP